MEFEDRVCIGLIENGVYGETGATIDDAEGLVDMLVPLMASKLAY